jgi:hypothetical protein
MIWDENRGICTQDASSPSLEQLRHVKDEALHFPWKWGGLFSIPFPWKQADGSALQAGHGIESNRS